MWHAGFLVEACGLSCGMHAGSGSLIRDRTQGPCLGSMESHPLDHQGSPTYDFVLIRYGKVTDTEITAFERRVYYSQFPK